MRFNEFKTDQLTEAVFELNSDVDMIYDKAFKDIVDSIRSNSWNGVYNPPKLICGSATLTSPECEEAHELNPIIIRTDKNGNFYNPTEQYISVSMNLQAINHLMNYVTADNPIKRALAPLPMHQRHRYISEFSPERIKGSIHHELAHWIDDTLHNSHIRNRINVAHELPNKRGIKHFNQGEEDVDLSKFEMNSQIHAMMQIRRADTEMWDLYSFEEMLHQNSSLAYIAERLRKMGKYEQWKKYLLKRLARENLLGQEMSRK